jgi:hypothetical protein
MRARLGGRLPAAVVLLSTAVAVLTGCGVVDNAQRVVDRSSLVNDLANRLSQAGSLTYTATYQLPGDKTATLAQAQDPTRASFIYPGGKTILGPDLNIACQTSGAAASCVRTTPSAASEVPQEMLDAVARQGLIPPTMVVSLLSAAALDADASIAEHDTTIAGEYATCVDVSGIDNTPSAQFSACITAAGVLASFTGDVNAKPVDIRLTRYQTTVAPDAFDLPANATVSPAPSHS